MKVKQLSIDDFQELYQLWKIYLWVYPEDEEKEKYENMLKLHPQFALGLIDENNQIVGSIIGAFDGRTLSIHRLCIKGELQKQGFGKMMVRKLEEKTKENGIKKIAIQVHESNIKVIGFYEKLGYEKDPVTTLKKNLN